MPFLRDFFGMGKLSGGDYLIIAGIVAIWAVVLQLVWQFRLLDKLLGMDVSSEALGKAPKAA